MNSRMHPISDLPSLDAQARRYVFSAGLVLADARTQPRKSDVVIQDGEIIDIVPAGAADTASSVCVDASGLILMPGMLNAHTHSSGNLMRSFSDAWNLEQQLNAGPAFRGEQTPREQYLTALIGAMESVSRGGTACYDVFYEFPLPSGQGIGQVMQAYRDVGMRSVIAPMLSDVSFYRAVPGIFDALPKEVQAQLTSRPASGWQSIMAAMESLLRLPFDDQVKLAIAPTIPAHCSDDFLKAAAQFARANGLGFHTHLAESKVQAVSGIERYGCSITRHLLRLGILDERFVGAHGVWIDKEDMAILADHGAGVAHNPGANMRLGVGVAAAREMLDAGLHVGIGTDSRVCSDNLNMFEALRLASYCSRIHGYDQHSWLNSREAFELATEGSARLLGYEGRLGRLAPGYRADIVFLDAANSNYVPLVDLVNQIVNAEDATAVRHVMVDGRMVYVDRGFPGLDVAAINQEIQAAHERLRSANAPRVERAKELESYFGDICSGLGSRAHTINRFIGMCPCADDMHDASKSTKKRLFGDV
jgi:5-methylthioadenosine/S-adenosylhomocysteine deaminase